MPSVPIPEIFWNVWFWIAVMAVIAAINYLWGKPSPASKPGKFFEKHKKTVTRVTDIFLLLVLAFCWISTLYMAGCMVFRALLGYSEYSLPVTEELTVALVFFCTPAIFTSGYSGVLIGFLSVFQSNLTKAKRGLLFIISLLPILFTVLLLQASPVNESGYSWSVVKSGLGSLALCWIFNGPAIFTGKHFTRVAWAVMRKLKLVSGKLPE